MVKKLTALLFGALLITGSALAESKADMSETKKTGRYSRNRKSNGDAKGGYVAETTVTDEVVSSGRGRYNGGSCSTGSCRAKSCNTCNTGRHSHSHACKDNNCGHCHRAQLPPKPCCEKAVTVYTEPCLHKQIEYSWTCPVEYTATNCPTC
jgi:hypothetical protein